MELRPLGPGAFLFVCDENEEMFFSLRDGHLVGGDWNMTLIFPYIGNVIIPTDATIFFRGVVIPPTSHRFYYFPLGIEIQIVLIVL